MAIAWWLRSGPDRNRDDVLGVLALVFLLRCMLDPWDLVYYHLPLVVSLAAWEARRGRSLPVLAVVASAGAWLTFVVYAARERERARTSRIWRGRSRWRRPRGDAPAPGGAAPTARPRAQLAPVPA